MIRLICLGILFGMSIPASGKSPGMVELLMNSTFKITSKPDPLGRINFGTGFILGLPLKENPNQGKTILVTAHHVFDSIKGDTALIWLRKKSKDTYKVYPFPFKIRSKGKAIWSRPVDPIIDIAAIAVSLPVDAGFSPLSIDALADEDAFRTFNLQPGDQLFCLGYPLGIANANGEFPILRSGKIASYPVIPFAINKAIVYDFAIFSGNSGGPVYFSEKGRVYNDTLHLDKEINFIAGLVTHRVETNQKESLQLGLVMPSPYIKAVLRNMN